MDFCFLSGSKPLVVLVFCFITTGVNPSSPSSCEAEGLCAIHVNETIFSCGELLKNASRDDLPDEYKEVWGCVEGIRATENAVENDMVIQHSCYRNGIWFSTKITYAVSEFVYLAMKTAFDDNNITTVDDATFSSYRRLRSLSLTYNHITVIETCSLPASGTVINFNISYNNLHCCSILHLKHWEAYWGVNVVYGECKVDYKTINFADDFTGQCKDDGGQFDCKNPTTASTTVSHAISTEGVNITIAPSIQVSFESVNITIAPSIQVSFENFLRTFFLICLGVAVAVATGVTIGTLKLVQRQKMRISSNMNNKVNVKEESKTLMEKHVTDKIQSVQKSLPDRIDLITYQSNNIPPIGHQLDVFCTGFKKVLAADSVEFPYIDTLPYTVDGYLDLSRV